MPSWLVYVLDRGYLGVAIFFVLSGFVIALSLDGKSINLSTVGRFILRRSIRLDPPYWFAIILTISFGVLASAIVKEHPIKTFSAYQILAHLFYAQDLLGYDNINIVSWTLCLEFQFYLVFALLIATGRPAIALTLGGIVSLLWPLGIGPELRPGLFLPWWHGFLLGAATYYALRKKLPAFLFVGYMSIIVVCAIAHQNGFSIIYAATALVIFAAGNADRLHRDLDWRSLQGLGAISYSLYLIHNPVMGATFRVGKLLVDGSAVWEATWWLISIIACIVAATITWMMIERPSTRLARSVVLPPERPLSTYSTASQR